LILAGDGAGDRQALVLAKSLISKKEENLVLDDGSANAAPKSLRLKGA
jgi:hypothetical protein